MAKQWRNAETGRNYSVPHDGNREEPQRTAKNFKLPIAPVGRPDPTCLAAILPDAPVLQAVPVSVQNQGRVVFLRGRLRFFAVCSAVGSGAPALCIAANFFCFDAGWTAVVSVHA
jgi:hypothetical protein